MPLAQLLGSQHIYHICTNFNPWPSYCAHSMHIQYTRNFYLLTQSHTYIIYEHFLHLTSYISDIYHVYTTFAHKHTPWPSYCAHIIHITHWAHVTYIFIYIYIVTRFIYMVWYICHIYTVTLWPSNWAYSIHMPRSRNCHCHCSHHTCTISYTDNYYPPGPITRLTSMECQRGQNPIIMDIHNWLWISIIMGCCPLWHSI